MTLPYFDAPMRRLYGQIQAWTRRANTIDPR